MRYKIGRNPVYRAPIPALIGGINTAASSDVVGDNQLSNCLNMMAMDGILRTRPGFKILNTDKSKGYISLSSDLHSTATNIKKYDFTVELDGKYGKLISVWDSAGEIKFYHCRSDGSVIGAGGIKFVNREIKNEFTITSTNGLYCFVTVSGAGSEPEYYIYSSSVVSVNGVQSLEWTYLTDDRIYVPTVMTNCRSDGIEESGILSGSFLLGYNLIGNRYSIEITAFNELRMEHYHRAVYRLPHPASAGSQIKITFRNEKAQEKKRIFTNVGSGWNYAINPSTGYEDIKEDGLNFALYNGELLVMYKERTKDNIPIIANVTDDTDWIDTTIDEAGRDAVRSTLVVLPGQNNITVTAEYEPDREGKKRVFSATCTAWYGGNRGLASGTRLFLGGMDGIYRNVLQWSDISNPLYFPENCNSEVGDPSQSITGFGKQADSLYIFKPNEIYAANYVLNEIQTDDTSLDLITDLTVTTAVFPLTQISAEIGCDCPGSIQLCRNRLCWAHSNGKVYTLVSSSQYNEKNIYELTDPIRRALPNISPHLLKSATSTDWEGYYVLSAGEHIFLMQYESYGYSRIYSYTSEEAASHKLPWFYLKIPYVPSVILSVENSLLTVNSFGPTVNSTEPQFVVVIHRADIDSVTDDIFSCEYSEVDKKLENFEITERQIPSMVQSKIFDFSRPEIKKVICHILAEIGGTDGNSIKLSVVTDRSRYEDTVEGDGNSPINLDDEFTLEGSSLFTPLPETIERTVMRINSREATPIDIKRINFSAPGFFRMVRVNPGIFGVRKFAVRLESDGAFSLGQVCIEYKMLGSVN